MSRLLVIALFLASYVVGLLITAPARVAAQVLASRMDGLTLHEAYGTLINGGVASAAYRGFPVGRLAWSPDLVGLARGCVQMHLTADAHIEQSRGRVLICLDGNTYLEDVSLHTDGDRLRSVPQLAAVNVFGQFELDIATAQWDGVAFSKVQGSLSWRDAAVAVFDTLRLGTLMMSLDDEAGDVHGRFQNHDAEVSIAGDLRLGADGAYAVDATLSSENEETAALIASLGLPSRADGVHRLQFTGSLTTQPAR